jgi:hypothetical protein
LFTGRERLLTKYQRGLAYAPTGSPVVKQISWTLSPAYTPSPVMRLVSAVCALLRNQTPSGGDSLVFITGKTPAPPAVAVTAGVGDGG